MTPLIGNTYSGSSMVGLASVLDKAKKGDIILMASYGSGAGSDAFIFRVSRNLEKKRGKVPVKEAIKEKDAALVITVDNGIVAYDQAILAKKIGLDLIITDHHLPAKEKPEAFAIVHSVKMCGAAVAWCLIKDYINDD